MINGKYFAARTIAHLTPILDSMGTRQCKRRFQRISDNSVNLDGVHFKFNVDEKGLEVRIEREDIKNFDKKIEVVKTPEFWENESLGYLKEQRDKYKEYLPHLKIEENGSGNFYFTSDLGTKNEDKAFFAVLNCIIKPVLYSLSKS